MKPTSFKLPKHLNLQIQERVMRDGFGIRGKNAWLVKAIETFLQLPEYSDYLDCPDAMEELDVILSIRLPESLKMNLDEAVGIVRSSFPRMEGVKSKIIRASIIQSLWK